MDRSGRGKNQKMLKRAQIRAPVVGWSYFRVEGPSLVEKWSGTTLEPLVPTPAKCWLRPEDPFHDVPSVLCWCGYLVDVRLPTLFHYRDRPFEHKPVGYMGYVGNRAFMMAYIAQKSPARRMDALGLVVAWGATLRLDSIYRVITAQYIYPLELLLLIAEPGETEQKWADVLASRYGIIVRAGLPTAEDRPRYENLLRSKKAIHLLPFSVPEEQVKGEAAVAIRLNVEFPRAFGALQPWNKLSRWDTPAKAIGPVHRLPILEHRKLLEMPIEADSEDETIS